MTVWVPALHFVFEFKRHQHTRQEERLTADCTALWETQDSEFRATRGWETQIFTVFFLLFYLSINPVSGVSFCFTDLLPLTRLSVSELTNRRHMITPGQRGEDLTWDHHRQNETPTLTLLPHRQRIRETKSARAFQTKMANSGSLEKCVKWNDIFPVCPSVRRTTHNTKHKTHPFYISVTCFTAFCLCFIMFSVSDHQNGTKMFMLMFKL